MNSLQKFQQDILRIEDKATERTYYHPFCKFLDEFSGEIDIQNISSTAEESSTQHEEKVGFPDITVRDNKRLIGWIEVKLPDDDLGNKKFEKQFKKYKDSLENIIFTNFRQWELWQWDADGKPKKVEEISFDVRSFSIGSEDNLKRFLIKFFEGQSYDARTPKQLALALAKKTRLLSQQVEENFDENDKESQLFKLKEIFEKTLVENIKNDQFANLFAETIGYCLFTARLEHDRKEKIEEFTLSNAIEDLPANVPVLRGMYNIIKEVSAEYKNIHHASQAIVDQLNNAKIPEIRKKLENPKMGKDPVAEYFYEDFLQAYDPEAKKRGGVYYTPKPVVDLIVRIVDYLLESKFDKTDGLANKNVKILDPATGTGTFLMSAIQFIHHRIEKKWHEQNMANKVFKEIVIQHILKDFFGFELMMAPYIMAHFKLSLLLEDKGFDWQIDTFNDNDKTNDRFHIYLANTLDDPNHPPQFDMPGLKLAEEAREANNIKKDNAILAIIGNPPYSNFGQMNKQPWILKLLDDYKKNLGEKKINLDDDYIKFIRFAQWKIDQAGKGIFAMITSNSFLDGITHRRMRDSILETFDEVYIINLHGNLRKGERCPDGSDDQNVFDIQTGVSINIFVKLPEKQGACAVKSIDVWGKREQKFDFCNNIVEESFKRNDWFESLGWKEINYRGFNKAFLSTKWSEFLGKLSFFVPNADDVSEKMVEYGAGWGAQEIFGEYNSGIQTKRDDFTIQFEEEKLLEIIEDLRKLDTETIRGKYKLPLDGRDWTINFAKNDLEKNKWELIPIWYRPFDSRKTIFTGKSKGFLAYPRTKTMKHMLKTNLGLIFTRFDRQMSLGYFGVHTGLLDIHFLDSAGDSMMTSPLYLYPQTKNSQSNLLGEMERKANLDPKFIKEFSTKLNLHWQEDGCGDLSQTFGPEDVFYYAYAIFHCPTYRTRYAEQLKIDFPRLPLTSDKELFKNLVKKGNELVNLHLLGENPFDNSETIFDNNSKWNVKTGGEKPANTEDWKVEEVEYKPADKRVYVNAGQYFEGIEKEVWEFMIGGYQVLEKWLKDRKKAERCLSADDLIHYMKIVVSLRETIKVMKEIDELIPEWPLK